MDCGPPVSPFFSDHQLVVPVLTETISQRFSRLQTTVVSLLDVGWFSSHWKQNFATELGCFVHIVQQKTVKNSMRRCVWPYVARGQFCEALK